MRKTGLPESSTAVITAFLRDVPWTGNRSVRPSGMCATALAFRSKFFVPATPSVAFP